MSFFQVSPYLIIYLTKSLSASSVAVKCVFSKGCLLISHVCNCLSAQLTCALLCLGYWSKLDYIKLDNLNTASLPDAKNDEDWLDDDWSIVA